MTGKSYADNFIELLIGVVVIVGCMLAYIIKGYSATGVLFVGGLLLLDYQLPLVGHKVLPSSQASTGLLCDNCQPLNMRFVIYV
ncbi:hypothetical protein BVW01_23305 [Mycobacterium tuberculosis]|nr:hypothetical protein BVW01_23305 [Mycobacterium tuberculosis]